MRVGLLSLSSWRSLGLFCVEYMISFRGLSPLCLVRPNNAKHEVAKRERRPGDPLEEATLWSPCLRTEKAGCEA